MGVRTTPLGSGGYKIYRIKFCYNFRKYILYFLSILNIILLY